MGPEVKIVRFPGLSGGPFGHTNMAAGRSDEAISHNHTRAMAPLGAAKLERILRACLTKA